MGPPLSRAVSCGIICTKEPQFEGGAKNRNNRRHVHVPPRSPRSVGSSRSQRPFCLLRPRAPLPPGTPAGDRGQAESSSAPANNEAPFRRGLQGSGPRARCAVHVVSRSEASGWVPPSPVSLSNRGARAHPQSPRALVPSLRRGAHVEVCLCRAPSPDGDSSERSQIFRGKGAAGGWAGSLGCQAAHCRR